jgi:hypothetical protein
LEDPVVDWRIILRGSSGSRVWGYGMDRAGLGLGQVAGNLSALMNLRVPYNAGKFFTS